MLEYVFMNWRVFFGGLVGIGVLLGLGIGMKLVFVEMDLSVGFYLVECNLVF